MPRLKSFVDSFLRLWNELGLNQRITIGVAATAVVAGMIALFAWSSRPNLQLLYGRLSDKDVAEVVGSLQEQNIAYELRGAGSIYVSSADVYRVRMVLASKGVPAGDGVGFEIFDRSNFGISDFVQRTNYLRAVQGELSRTISQLRGVRSARVMIVQPENRLLFADEKSKPTASVFIDQAPGALNPEAINSIRSLVSNAVEGLQLDDVAVVDSSGNVLTKGLTDDPTLGTAHSQMRFRKGVEDYLTQKVDTMLAAVLGPGNAVVRVSADVDTEAATTVEERWDPDGQVIRNEQTNEDSTVTNESEPSPNANTPVGATANIPSANTASAGKTSEQVRKEKTLAYEINRTTVSSVKNPGGITRLSAAVFVAAGETPRTPAELESLRRMVVNALGVDSKSSADIDRTVSVEEFPFQATAVEEPGAVAGAVAQYQNLIPAGVALLVAAVILFVFLRMLKRARPEEDVVFEVLGQQKQAAAGDAVYESAVSPEMLNRLIREDSASLGAALREWAGAENGSRK